MSDQKTARFPGMNNLRPAAARLLAVFAMVFLTDMGIAAAVEQDAAAQIPEPIHIGVLAHKGPDVCREMWQPTIDYLNAALPGRPFDLTPLTFEDIEPAVRSKSVDFLICNPAIYVDLEVRYGITQTMTLRNLVGKQFMSEFGGVVFCRAERSDLKRLRDARGQRLAAVRATSFGGWNMALREFRAEGVDPERDTAALSFLGTHPAVVRAVLAGDADIGTVRTDTLERMAADGEIRLETIRVIPAGAAALRSDFPYLHSTRLYPEWPFAKLADTSEDLARRVTVSLLSMPSDSPAALAAQIGGWGICLDYAGVHDCLRELRLPPYEHYGQMSWADMWLQHWQFFGAIAALIIALSGTLLLLHGRNLALTMVSGQNRLLLASAGEGICGVDIHGMTIFVNPAAGKILGYTAKELIGKNLHALTHHSKPDGRPCPSHECPIFMACKDGTFLQGSDEYFYRKDGNPIPVSYSSRPIIDRGSIRGAVICFQDITEQKRTEESIREVNATLEQRVGLEVSKSMEQERLLIRQSRLAAMGEMIGNIAHQWRQPLNALGLLLFNIKDAFQFGTLDADYLNAAVADGNRLVQKMSTTISDFSNFFRPDKQRLIFSAREQIREAAALVDSSFQNSGIAIHIDAPRDLKLEGFPNEYSQVLLNLLSNAKEAILARNRPFSGRVDIVLTALDGQGCVSVRDNGGGIPEAVLDRIFDPYFSSKEKGSGIGLYMSKMIIERSMNGSITAKNLAGGAEFIVASPLAAENAYQEVKANGI